MFEMLQQFDPEDIVVIHQRGQLRRWQFLVMIQIQVKKITGYDLLPGDRVLLSLPNSLEMLVSYYACLAAGLVAVPVSNRMAPGEVHHIITHSQPKLIVSSPGLKEQYGFSEFAPCCPIETLEPLETPTSSQTEIPSEIYQWPDQQAAIIYYTSGSTGQAKGVLYSHKTLRNNSRIYRAQFNIDADDRSVLCHCMASNFILSQVTLPFLDAGGSVHIVDFGSVRQTVTAIESGASFLQLIPWFAIKLLDYCEGNGIKSPGLRVALVGGDRVPLRIIDQFERVMGVPLSQNFGMTETNTYTVTPANGPGRKAGSIGLPLPEVEIEIRSPEGHLLTAGKPGEIWVNTPAGMDCYWNDEQQTLRTMIDGWYATGDSGHFDDDGILWFDARIKHIIICDGDNIYPSEVEKEIARHPEVREVAIFGLADEVHGEVVAAALVMEKGASLKIDQLRKFLSPRLSNNKIPQAILPCRALPLSGRGKIDLEAIRKQLKAGRT